MTLAAQCRVGAARRRCAPIHPGAPCSKLPRLSAWSGPTRIAAWRNRVRVGPRQEGGTGGLETTARTAHDTSRWAGRTEGRWRRRTADPHLSVQGGHFSISTSEGGLITRKGRFDACRMTFRSQAIHRRFAPTGHRLERNRHSPYNGIRIRLRAESPFGISGIRMVRRCHRTSSSSRATATIACA